MRRLAEDLGTSAMSLYWHVASRQDLLVGMLDHVAGRVRLPDPVGDPRAEITAVLTAIHDALRADPWAVRLIVIERLAGPRILPAVERIFAALTAAGFAGRDALVAYGLMWHYCAGELLSAHPATEGPTFAQTMVRTADPATFPTLRQVSDSVPHGASSDHFAENLQRLLDGLMR
jgi:AcrR family transcriptional regulator